jgi:hypothetical protein
MGALDLLRASREWEWLSPRARLAVERLLQKVDESFNLAGGWDLIEETQVLIAELDQIT